jgi:hypothetical protein
MLKEKTQSHIKRTGLNLRHDGGRITIEYLESKVGPSRPEFFDRLPNTLAVQNVGAPSEEEEQLSLIDRLTRDIVLSSSSRLRWATASNSIPEVVGATWRVVRSNSLTPSWVSSSRINKLRPDGVMNNAAAAREKLRYCATKRNERSWREVKSIIEYS